MPNGGGGGCAAGDFYFWESAGEEGGGIGGGWKCAQADGVISCERKAVLMLETLSKIIPVVAVAGAAAWALYLFNRQQAFKRLQNLSALWKEFFKSDEMLSLFDLMNHIDSATADAAALETFPSRQKLRYLALIEEVALYAERFEVDRKYVAYLFGWHFRFPYLSERTRGAFWFHLGGDDEMNAPYWAKSRKLAAEIDPEVSAR